MSQTRRWRDGCRYFTPFKCSPARGVRPSYRSYHSDKKAHLGYEKEDFPQVFKSR